MKKFTIPLLFFCICSQAVANNSKCWDISGRDDKSRPDIICKNLTQEFILSFKGETREKVIERMTSPGSQPSDDVIHYLSNAKTYNGDINFQFSDNKVTAITAIVGDDNYTLVWNAKNNFSCSDFPASNKKCPKNIITPTGMLGLKADSPEAISIQEVLDPYTERQ